MVNEVWWTYFEMKFHINYQHLSFVTHKNETLPQRKKEKCHGILKYKFIGKNAHPMRKLNQCTLIKNLIKVWSADRCFAETILCLTRLGYENKYKST